MKTLICLMTIILAGELFAQAPPPPQGPPPGMVGPEFPGGEAAYQKYLQDNIRYPQDEKQHGISGTVYINFVVDQNGKISNAKVQTGVPNGPGLAEEALRVIAAMPDWTPASYNGTPTKVSITQPVKFSLPADSTVAVVPDTADNQVYLYADKMPEFPGGENAFQEYLKQNVKFPAEERKNKKEGTIFITFVVDKDGTIDDIVVIRSVEGAPGFSAEAIRVLSTMPNWSPGILKGKPVKVSQTVPISFRL